MSYIGLKEFSNLHFKIPTFYLRSVVIVSHQLAGRIRSIGKGWAQFCLIGYIGHQW